MTDLFFSFLEMTLKAMTIRLASAIHICHITNVQSVRSLIMVNMVGFVVKNGVIQRINGQLKQ